jgi:hypothetical protein
MPNTIAELRTDLRQFDAAARRAATASNPEAAMQTAWKRQFNGELSNASAKSFVKYYRDMRTKSKRASRSRQAGGMAPIHDTGMAPGLSVGVYGNFPFEAGTDMKSIQDLDVYFSNSLNRGCGVENSSLTVPETMGSNKVGGARKSRRAAARKSYKKRRTVARKTMRRNRKYRGRGGNLLDSLSNGASYLGMVASHPYISSAPPNVIQQASAAMSGSTSPVPFPSAPTTHAWGYQSAGISGIINPGVVSSINADLTKLASPAPWQTSN